MPYDDPCPKCGHRRKRQLMSSSPDAPSLRDMWFDQNCEPWQYFMVRTGAIVLAVFAIVGIMAALHIHV